MPPAKKSTRTTKKTTKKSAATRTVKKTAKRTTRRTPTKTLSAAHKSALTAGRAEARHVRAYLDALGEHKPQRGRQRTPATIKKQLAQAQTELRNASGFRKLELTARRIELEAELKAKTVRSDLSALRKNFVRHAAKYAGRKGIPKRAFQEAGVPSADIRDAGIK